MQDNPDFVLHLLKIYVDDKNIICTVLPPGSRLINGKLVIVESEIESDRQIPGDIRTSKIYLELANSIMSFIKLTVDSPSLHENGYMAILDLEVKMVNNQVVYRFFKKSQSTPFVIPFKSALPDNVKRNSLIQKGVTILRNTKRDLPWEEKAELLSRYLMYSMMISGYPEKWRLETLKAAITTYER